MRALGLYRYIGSSSALHVIWGQSTNFKKPHPNQADLFKCSITSSKSYLMLRPSRIARIFLLRSHLMIVGSDTFKCLHSSARLISCFFFGASTSLISFSNLTTASSFCRMSSTGLLNTFCSLCDCITNKTEVKTVFKKSLCGKIFQFRTNFSTFFG